VSVWAIIPFIDLPEMTMQAANDVLDQSVETRVLLIANDCTDETVRQMETFCKGSDRVLLWNHRPALPALGATWNEGLRFCFGAGAEEVLVVNNDVRLHPRTVHLLGAALLGGGEEPPFFVSAVNAGGIADPYEWDLSMKGGPDFSCFMVTREFFEKYPFDPELTYAGDLDTHRRVLLAGDGDKMYSVNVPYHHLASQTLKQLPPEKAQIYHAQADAHRAYYARKWGGPVNLEKWRVPFSGEDEEGITTPELFDAVRAKW